MRSPLLAAALLVAAPAGAADVWAGALAHDVDTVFTKDIAEAGTDLNLGYRFDRQDALAAIGRPAPYLFASVNTGGDTSFAGGGLSWTIGRGSLYFRPGIGIVVHDGPRRRIARNVRVDLGSRLLFEPEASLGYRLSRRLAVEAAWVHVSHARIFSRQNPGLDTIGLRAVWALR